MEEEKYLCFKSIILAAILFFLLPGQASFGEEVNFDIFCFENATYIVMGKMVNIEDPIAAEGYEHLKGYAIDVEVKEVLKGGPLPKIISVNFASYHDSEIKAKFEKGKEILLFLNPSLAYYYTPVLYGSIYLLEESDIETYKKQLKDTYTFLRTPPPESVLKKYGFYDYNKCEIIYTVSGGHSLYDVLKLTISHGQYATCEIKKMGEKNSAAVKFRISHEFIEGLITDLARMDFFDVRNTKHKDIIEDAPWHKITYSYGSEKNTLEGFTETYTNDLIEYQFGNLCSKLSKVLEDAEKNRDKPFRKIAEFSDILADKYSFRHLIEELETRNLREVDRDLIPPNVKNELITYYISKLDFKDNTHWFQQETRVNSARVLRYLTGYESGYSDKFIYNSNYEEIQKVKSAWENWWHKKAGISRISPVIQKTETTGLSIITDEIEYEPGEVVKITVKNGSSKPIWYMGDLCEPYSCGIEQLKDNNWEQVEKLFCIFPERGFVISPEKLEPGKEFVREWRPMKRAEYDALAFIDAGKYRASFSYGPDKSSYRENIIYSKEFTIKEKSYPTYGKIVNVNLLMHRDGTVTETEPIEIKTGIPTSLSVLKQLKGDYLLRIGEEPDRISIGTVLWNQSFSVDFDYSGPTALGEDYSKIDYDRVSVTFRIPRDFRMKALQLWYKPKNKLIFWKELPMFYPIRGTVLNRENIPIKRAMAILSQGEDVMNSTYTDEDGNYLFSEVRPGEYSVLIEPPMRPVYPNVMKGYKEKINLADDAIINVNFTLEPCGSIAGKITDTQGNPLTYGQVYEIGFGKPQYALCDRPKECELGTFIIPYLEPRDYRIGAEVKIGEKYIEIPPKEAKVELGKTTIVNFVVER